MHMKLLATACTTACLSLGTGCLWANERSESLYGYEARAVLGSDGHLEGAQAHFEGGLAGLSADLEANVRDAVRPDDPDTHQGIGLGFSLRASLFGILATDHKFERYLDFGAEAGVGGGLVRGVPPHGVSSMSSGWYGAWVEVGTVSLGSGYLALTGGIRREVFTDPWLDQTQLAIGVAWRKHELMGKLNLHD
jgi:hypothetical protein